jgi:hypothetical protein
VMNRIKQINLIIWGQTLISEKKTSLS